MSDDFARLHAMVRDPGTTTAGYAASAAEAHEVITRIEARLSTAEEALRAIRVGGETGLLTVENALELARNALQPDQKEPR